MTERFRVEKVNRDCFKLFFYGHYIGAVSSEPKAGLRQRGIEAAIEKDVHRRIWELLHLNKKAQVPLSFALISEALDAVHECAILLAEVHGRFGEPFILDEHLKLPTTVTFLDAALAYKKIADRLDALIAAHGPLPENDAEELAGLRKLMEAQHKCTEVADRLWQKAHDKPNVLPDLGALIDWLMEEAGLT